MYREKCTYFDKSATVPFIIYNCLYNEALYKGERYLNESAVAELALLAFI